MRRRGPFDHVCCFCSKRHKNGAKTFDKSRERCAKNCTRKPITARPHGWVGKGACCVCGATTTRGLRKCKNRTACVTRSLSRMRVLPAPDDRVTRERYQQAVAA